MLSSYKLQNSLSTRFRKASLTLLAALALALTSTAQTPLEVRGKGSDVIVFPNGTASFADKVTLFQPGTPLPIEEFRQPDGALGVPDFKQPDGKTYVSLGKGGVLTLEFVDNRLVDIPGNDLYIFEAGPDIENTFVEISEDGSTWIDVGKIQGSTAYIDIGPKVRSGQQFRFIRLTDDPNQGESTGRTPGADIDAVGAIGSIAAPADPNLEDSPGNGTSLTYFNAVAFYLPGKLPVTWSNTYPQRILGEPDAERQGGGAMELGKGGVCGAFAH